MTQQRGSITWQNTPRRVRIREDRSARGAMKRKAAMSEFASELALDDLPEALRYAKDRVDDAIKVVVKARMGAAHKVAAE